MFRPLVALAAVGSACGMALALVSSGSAAIAHPQTPPTQTPATQQLGQPAAQATVPPPVRMFTADAGLMLNFIKADKTADFEAVVAKLKEALQKSAKPERKQQAASWKVFKSPDPAAGGNVLYVFVMDPAVKGADYSIASILAEAFPPSEMDELFKRYTSAYGPGQNVVNLALVADLDK